MVSSLLIIQQQLLTIWAFNSIKLSIICHFFYETSFFLNISLQHKDDLLKILVLAVFIWI